MVRRVTSICAKEVLKGEGGLLCKTHIRFWMRGDPAPPFPLRGAFSPAGRWAACRALVIDEVSMLDGDFFEQRGRRRLRDNGRRDRLDEANSLALRVSCDLNLLDCLPRESATYFARVLQKKWSQS